MYMIGSEPRLIWFFKL